MLEGAVTSPFGFSSDLAVANSFTAVEMGALQVQGAGERCGNADVCSIMANRFRLLLHTFAFVLLWRLRQTLAGTELAAASVHTVKLKLLKIGARVVRSVRRVHFAGS